jgi:cell division protein FtsL
MKKVIIIAAAVIFVVILISLIVFKADNENAGNTEKESIEATIKQEKLIKNNKQLKFKQVDKEQLRRMIRKKKEMTSESEKDKFGDKE